MIGENKKNGPSTKVPKKARKKAPESEEKKLEKKIYQRYLKSEQFQEVKEIVHKRDNNICQVCGRTIEECSEANTQLQVHHRSYEHLGMGGEKEASDCILLCGCCHRSIHSAKRNLRRFMDKSPIMKNWKDIRK